MVIAHVLREVDFLRLAVLYLNHSRAGSIVRRNEDTVATHNWCGDVGYVVSRARIVPKQFAVFQIETHSAIVSEEDYLSGIPNLHGHTRRVTCLVALTLPNQSAVLLVQCYD